MNKITNDKVKITAKHTEEKTEGKRTKKYNFIDIENDNVKIHYATKPEPYNIECHIKILNKKSLEEYYIRGNRAEKRKVINAIIVNINDQTDYYNLEDILPCKLKERR